MKSFIDEVRAIDLLKQLVRIDSVNPSLVPGAKGEAEIAEYLSGWMRSLGLKTYLDAAAPGRCNAVGVLKGVSEGKRLMLNGHTDVVGADYMTMSPFEPVIREGKMYGRGTFDMNGGLVSSLAALKAVIDSGVELKGDVVVAAVCDEEFASIGTEHAAANYPVDAAIIGEATNLQILR
ncbi:MAG: M20/M25/M40 family metallo-hydrolase, partial [Candidatus Bathyarchaeota archaeon]|nr:M20/M25/M40 family metallo-hydrolase [Candidatus Bathyarchaeota archaeon]